LHRGNIMEPILKKYGDNIDEIYWKILKNIFFNK
jgi:hypothetical protein